MASGGHSSKATLSGEALQPCPSPGVSPVWLCPAGGMVGGTQALGVSSQTTAGQQGTRRPQSPPGQHSASSLWPSALSSLHPATCSECCLKFLWVTRPLPGDQAFVSSCRITSLLRGLPPATRKHFGVEMPPLEGAPPGARAQGSPCRKVTGSSKRWPGAWPAAPVKPVPGLSCHLPRGPAWR